MVPTKIVAHKALNHNAPNGRITRRVSVARKEMKIMAITHKKNSGLHENTERPLHGNQQKASESLLRERSVLARVELSRAYWRKLIAAKKAPAPIKIGKSSRWVASEIDAYIQARIAASRAKNAA